MERGAKLGDNKILNKMICNNCTGAPKLELRCTGCNKVRVRDHFSSAQRNDPDTARCRKCVSEMENVRPGQQEQEHQHEEVDSDEEYMTVSTRGQNPPMLLLTLSNRAWAVVLSALMRPAAEACLWLLATALNQSRLLPAAHTFPRTPHPLVHPLLVAQS
jgi:ribosomal protein L40E